MINSFHYRFNTLPSCTLGIRRRRDKLGIAMYYSRRPRWQRYDTTQGCCRIHRRAIAIGWFRGGCRRPRDRFRAVRATPRGAYARGLRRAIYRPSPPHRGGGGGGLFRHERTSPWTIPRPPGSRLACLLWRKKFEIQSGECVWGIILSSRGVMLFLRHLSFGRRRR